MAVQRRLEQWFAKSASWVAIAIGLATGAILAIAPILFSPGIYVSTMPHDTLSMADIGYRMAQGQTPGRDFHSAFGVLFQWQMGLSWKLSPTVAGAMKSATLIFFVITAAIGAYVARTRLSNLGSLAVLLAVVVLGAAPYARADANLGGATYAMFYNREAWVLLLLAMLFWLPSRRPAPIWVDGLLLGLLVASCVYFKISYGGIALLFCGVWFLIAPSARWGIIFSAVSALMFAILLELIYRFGFNALYLADILLPAKAGGARIAHIAFNLFSARAELLTACVAIPLLAAWRWSVGWRNCVFVAFSAAASLLIVWQNAQLDGLVALWAAVAVVLEGAAIPGEGTLEPRNIWIAAAGYGAWAALTLTPSLLAVGQAALGAWAIKPADPQTTAIADMRFDTPRADHRIRGLGAVYGDEYAAALTDGLTLLKACPPSASIANLDMFEPFSLLQQRPPNHGWTWRHFGHSFSMTTYPDASKELSGVDCILIPSQPNDPATTQALLSLYSFYLSTHFANVRKSPGWTLRLRTAP